MSPKKNEERLNSWKEIGAYLQRNEATVRRWEKREALPVHRHTHESRSSVYAYPNEIDTWQASRKVVPEPPLARPLWKIPAFAMTMLLCLVMVGNGVRPVSAQQGRGPQSRQVWAVQGANDNSVLGWISPDGHYLSFTDGSGDLIIRDLRAGTNQRLTDNGTRERSTTSAGASAISPDGRQVAYAWSDGKTAFELRILPIIGGTPKTVFRDQSPVGEPSGWTPDGKQLLVKRNLPDRGMQLAMVSVQDGSIRVLKSFPWGTLDSHAHLSPDGRYVAYAAKTDEFYAVFVLAVDGSRESKIMGGPATNFMVQWSPDGARVLFLSDRTGDSLSLWSVPVEEGKATGPATLMKANTGYISLIRGTTRDGALHYVTDTNRRNVYVAGLEPGMNAVKTPTLATQRFINSTYGGSWSPDGQYLAFFRYKFGGPQLVIQTLRTGAEREVPTQVRLSPYISAISRWFPDQRSVLVVSWEDRAFYRVEVESGKAELLHRFDSVANGVDLSPDGKTIYYLDGSLWRADLDPRSKTELRQPPKGQYFSSVAVSPDSAQLAYEIYDPEMKSTTLEVMSATGGPARRVREFRGQSGYSLAWSPDQHYLLYASKETEAPLLLWKIPAAGGEPEKMFSFDSGGIYYPQVHSDGRKMVFSTLSNTAAELWALENFLPQSTKK